VVNFGSGTAVVSKCCPLFETLPVAEGELPVSLRLLCVRSTGARRVVDSISIVWDRARKTMGCFPDRGLGIGFTCDEHEITPGTFRGPAHPAGPGAQPWLPLPCTGLEKGSTYAIVSLVKRRVKADAGMVGALWKCGSRGYLTIYSPAARLDR